MSIQPQQATPASQSALTGLPVSAEFAALFADVSPGHPAIPDDKADAAVRQMHTRLYAAVLDSWTEEAEWRTHAADTTVSKLLFEAIPGDRSDADLALVSILTSSIGGIRQGDVDSLAATTLHASLLMAAWVRRVR